MADIDRIRAPRGQIINVRGRNGNVRAQLIWKPGFEKAINRKYGKNGRLQQMIDSEVLRGCDPYVPKDTSMLKKSGVLHTVIGSGLVRYRTPYARLQYYHGRAPGLSKTGELRGLLWFERWKKDHGKATILKIQNANRRGLD